jgi:arylsulfatase A-like enzyme
LDLQNNDRINCGLTQLTNRSLLCAIGVTVQRTLSPIVSSTSSKGLVLFVLSVYALVAVDGMSAVGSDAASKSRPNIVLVVTDDLGWGDLACHGNSIISTPNIDRMLQRGGELTRFYVAPVCSPTRASLMTGRYNYRTRVIDTFRGHSMMEPEEKTIAEILSQAGYATGIFGKWHLGDCYPLRPQDQGFTQAVVLRGGGFGQPSDPPKSRGRYTNPTLWRNGEEFVAEGYCTDVFFNEAIRFIDQCVEADTPFFAYVATNAPHGPFADVPDSLYRKYKAADLTSIATGNDQQLDKVARIFAMIENIDENVGRLRMSLSQLGVARDTLLIFMSDNGPDGARFVGNRRGTKGQVLEGGITSPFIVEWPGRVQPGLRSGRIAAHIDVLPTILEAATVDPPTDTQIDGRSLVPLLIDSGAKWPERTLVIQSHRGNKPVPGHNFAVVQQRWKLVRASGFEKTEPSVRAPYRLYDLWQDPRESEDLSGRRPKIVTRLRNYYDQWLEDVSTTRSENYAPPRIIVGSEKEPVTTLSRQDWQATGPGWGSNGEWLLHLESKCIFDVEIVFENPLTGKATLACGPFVLTKTFDVPTPMIMFGNLEVPAGDISIHIELDDGRSKVAPYFIKLVKR